MAIYKLKTILGHQFEANEEQLKWCYHSWAEGAINVDREEKPMYYFTHYVLSDISFTEFKKIVLEEEENDKNDL